jgi:hypothetical protein
MDDIILENGSDKELSLKEKIMLYTLVGIFSLWNPFLLKEIVSSGGGEIGEGTVILLVHLFFFIPGIIIGIVPKINSQLKYKLLGIVILVNIVGSFFIIFPDNKEWLLSFYFSIPFNLLGFYLGRLINYLVGKLGRILIYKVNNETSPEITKNSFFHKNPLVIFISSILSIIFILFLYEALNKFDSKHNCSRLIGIERDMCLKGKNYEDSRVESKQIYKTPIE